MILPHFDIEKNYYIVTILTAVFTVAGLVWKYTKKMALHVKDKYNYLENSLNKIQEISKEFVPNHGSSLKDILNRMQSELARNTEVTEKIATRQQWLFDNRDIPIFESDEEGKCVWANTAYLDLVKRDMKYLLGHGWKNIIVAEDRDRVVHNWELCVKDGRDSEDTYTILDAEGKRIKVFTVASKTGRFGYVGAIKIVDETSE